MNTTTTTTASRTMERTTKTDEALPDRALVRRTLAGDAEAFAVLHRRYYARIYRLALFRCRSAADAEDIAAETFVRAISHLPGYRFQGESLFPWLSRIAANLAADQRRRQGGTPPLSLDQRTAADVRALIEAVGAPAPDPHEMAERQETQALLRAAIATLPPDQADAILLRFGGDLPLSEIALAMGRTEGAIKSLIHRGLVNLRRTLLAEAERSGVIDELRRRLGAEESSSAARPQTRTSLYGPTER